ncbi:MAG TPA: MaoC family dehydratase N-terminal domain-containing protein [Bryobacteraceae bacterium]|jgi:3-methylfumaryl-CoA hydratase|nr:MaoC family dehydratase N-terminal domain-containing protein [Bryobacteraceae bacterium]
MSFSDWIGKTEVRSDIVTAGQVVALSATLDREDPEPQPGDPLPPLWHWLFFLDRHRASELGPDGHARRGGLLPPIPLPRRMWAGSRFEFHHPLRIGDQIKRETRVIDIKQKSGRSGPLVFVVVRHEISNAAGLAINEEHDIVYRDHGAATPLQPAPADAAWERSIQPDDVLLFRYSALTFNGHRIHYDRRYAAEVEGYPGLVVHGPLIATLLMDLLRRNQPAANVARFSFRAVSPLFDIAPFMVCGKPDGKTIALWAKDAAGNLAMSAEALIG